MGWLSQKAIAQLFDAGRSAMVKHLCNIFKNGELDEHSVCSILAQTASEGKTYRYKYYSLAAIIAVGIALTLKEQWATNIQDVFTKQGYVLDKGRLINGQIFDENYFDRLISSLGKKE